MSIVKGFENYNNSDCVAYHYESQTRNEDPDNIKKLNYDYQNFLYPCIITNMGKLKSKITLV